MTAITGFRFLALTTLADVRWLLLRLPKEKQALSTWQHVAGVTMQAASDGSTTQVMFAIWLALKGDPAWNTAASSRFPTQR